MTRQPCGCVHLPDGTCSIICVLCFRWIRGMKADLNTLRMQMGR